MTADLNTIQFTSTGAQIVWTSKDRRPANDGYVLTGDVIGKRGKPVAGFCAAVLWDSGRIGPVHHINGLSNRLIG